MNERRLYLVFKVTPEGLDLTITPKQPDEPDAVAVIRTVGDVLQETTIHLPGATAREG
ncbi:hypothetical protein [Brevundimonas sp.]|uniref:hypothetical protein n=1 Tax=Brevundimonas sp. TaxID=1871086 RepID=UPI0028987FA1|nr:hypothetical protein [Brevundimonas sp.]